MNNNILRTVTKFRAVRPAYPTVANGAARITRSQYIKIGEAGIINFNVWCEDNESIVERRGVTEALLPTIENEAEEEALLTLKIGGADFGVNEAPLNKHQIRQVEIRAALQTKNEDTGKTTIHVVKHIFVVKARNLDDNTEVYTVSHWIEFADNRKVKDISA